MQKIKNKKQNSKGITLVALLITVIIMLILAGVGITALTQEGFINIATDAIDKTELAEKKQILEEAIALTIDNFTEENLMEILEKYNVEISEDEEGFVIKFVDSNIYYAINESGELEHIEASGIKTLTVICKDTAGNVLTQKDYAIFRNNYSITLPQVEDFEPLSEILEGEILANTTINETYYQIFDDDTELLFTGLDSSGTATTVESEIVEYMVGDGISTAGNGLIEKTAQGILKIPDTYNGKPVTKIGQFAFKGYSNIEKAYTGDGVENILGYAFQNSKIKCLEIGKNVESIEGHAFLQNSNLETIMFKNKMTTYGQCFAGCKNWKYTLVSEESDYIVKENVLYSSDGKILITCPKGMTGEFVTNNNIERIENGAFWGCQYETIIITQNVIGIGDYAFAGSGLKNIELGENINGINSHTFNSSSLETMTINSATYLNKITEENAYYMLNESISTIYIKEDINSSVTTYITDNYTPQELDESDETYKEGYIKYVKNSAT